ncbi:hypothetical protein L1887_22975 [Cichorium endivia]|nr:hypothetical protein L1887_22975 [Cichorium endivia]
MANMSNRGMTKRFLIQEMDRSIKQMLKLVEEEGDSFAKKAEIYCQKRPRLVSQVKDFYRMFRSLAERYNEAKAELRRSRPPDLRSQNSGTFDMFTGHNVFSEPPSAMTSPERRFTPERRLTRRLSEIPNFEMLGNQSGYETSTFDSGSDSDDSLFQGYSSSSNYRQLRKKVVELEAELRKVQMEHEENRLNSEIVFYEEELRIAKEKIRLLEEEIAKLRIKLQKYESMEPRRDYLSDESLDDFETPRVNDRLAEDTLEQEVKRFRREFDSNGRFSNQVESGQKEVEKQELSEENSQLREQVTRLSKQRRLDNNIKEWERCRRLEHDLKRIGIKKNELEDELEQLKMDRDGLVSRVSELEEEMSLKDDQIDEMNDRLEKLHLENQKSINSVEEMRCRSRELKKLIEKQQEMIEEGAEEKRQAVGQLRYTLQHYRNAYQMLRQDLLEHKKPVMASQGDIVSI